MTKSEVESQCKVGDMVMMTLMESKNPMVFGPDKVFQFEASSINVTYSAGVDFYHMNASYDMIIKIVNLTKMFEAWNSL